MDPPQYVERGTQTSPFSEPANFAQAVEQNVVQGQDLALGIHAAPLRTGVDCDAVMATATVASPSTVDLLDDPTQAKDPVCDDSTENSAYRRRRKIRKLLVRAHRSAEPFLCGPARGQARDNIAMEFATTVTSARDLQDVCHNDTYRSLLAPENPDYGLFRSSNASAFLDQAQISLGPCSPIKPPSAQTDLNRSPRGAISLLASGALNEYSPNVSPAREVKPFNFNSPIRIIREDPSPLGTRSLQRSLREGGSYLATIQILPKPEALLAAEQAYDFVFSDAQPKPFIVWTDGSADPLRRDCPMTAAVAYQRPTTGWNPEWVVRAFGIEAPSRDIRSAEAIGVEKGLEIALREWEALNWDYRASIATEDECIYEEDVGDYEDHQEVQPVVVDLTHDSDGEQNLEQERSSDVKAELQNFSTEVELPDYVDSDGADDELDAGADWYDICEPALEVSETPQPFKEVHIYTDSQDVLNCLNTLGNREMPDFQQEIVHRIISLMEELAAKRVSIRFHWVPGHAGIEGNEKADAGCGIARKLIVSRYQGGPKVWDIDVDIDDPLMKQTVSKVHKMHRTMRKLRQQAKQALMQQTKKLTVATARAQRRAARDEKKAALAQKEELLGQAKRLRKQKKKAHRLAIAAGSSADMPIVID